MNIAVLNLRDILKYFIKLLIVFFLIYIFIHFVVGNKSNITKTITNRTSDKFLMYCMETSLPMLNINKEKKTHNISITNLMDVELAMLNPKFIQEKTDKVIENKIDEQQIIENKNTTTSPQVVISKTAETKTVTERNLNGHSTNQYNTTKIDNQCDYEITEEMLTPDVEITDKKNIIIYHTHTCESYTSSPGYEYEMTGNYRTTDNNYNIVRVGTELTTYLTQKGFNVVHDGTYHDYPSYSGSYARSLETAKRLLEGQSADIVIDMHRDAMGNGDTYGPTVMVDGKRVAQLMFVIGTDGGGLEHPNWINNLKIAVKIQEKANEMYPGLFRPIIIRNSRYNQHLAKGASIIEVGATANTLDECLLSMQCLANVLEEVCK